MRLWQYTGDMSLRFLGPFLYMQATNGVSNALKRDLRWKEL